MNKIILEIGLEEVPSLYIDKTLKELKELTEKEFSNQRINYRNIITYGTPRRFVIYIEDLQSQQEDIFLKIKGPAIHIAIDKDGNYQKPAIKFAESNGIQLDNLIVDVTDKGKYIYANKLVKGEKIELLLPDIFRRIINGIHFPKSMRWGSGSFRFIRPIRWLLALYNESIISFDLEEISSNRFSYGHRLLSPEKIIIRDVDDYYEQMKKTFVIIDPEERKTLIKNTTSELLKKYTTNLNIDEKLLEEVKNLIEYPQVLLGQFEKEYLKLPADVLKIVMIKHQKYFPVYSKNGNLMPLFLVVINGNDLIYADSIIQGNERVLKARLEDSKFFYNEDQKIGDKGKNPLDQNREKLKKVIFQEKLGTLFDKTSRLIAITHTIGEELQLDCEQLLWLNRSAELSKSDLITEMVKEFPELQGIMGKEYALLQGEKSHVAQAIYEQYLPRYADDQLPETVIGCILSIADKLDNIVSSFMNGFVPDGSQDPYAVRRQTLGIIHILLQKKWELLLANLISQNIKLLRQIDRCSSQIRLNDEIIHSKIKDFIFQRYRYLLLEKGIRYDIIDAVLNNKPKNIYDAFMRIQAIQKIYEKPEFVQIIMAAVRVYNLSKNTISVEIDQNIFREKEEEILYHSYLKAQNKINQCIDKKDYIEVFNLFSNIVKPINRFFDTVLVMDDDPMVRKNRLSLLRKISKMFNSIADLSKITLSKTTNME